MPSLDSAGAGWCGCKRRYLGARKFFLTLGLMKSTRVMDANGSSRQCANVEHLAVGESESNLSMLLSDGIEKAAEGGVKVSIQRFIRPPVCFLNWYQTVNFKKESSKKSDTYADLISQRTIILCTLEYTISSDTPKNFVQKRDISRNFRKSECPNVVLIQNILKFHNCEKSSSFSDDFGVRASRHLRRLIILC